MIAELIDPAILGFILVGVMLFAIFVGFPISFTLIFLGFVFGYLGFGKLVFYLMTLQFSMVMTEQTLAAVPLFVFMGIMMEQAGLMERLFSAFQMMLARVKGLIILRRIVCFCYFCSCNWNSWCLSYYFGNYGCKINEQIKLRCKTCCRYDYSWWNFGNFNSTQYHACGNGTDNGNSSY